VTESSKIISEQGIWWRPETPTEKFSGTIAYSSCGGLTIELLGSLRGVEVANRAVERFDIWGLTASGRPISLFDAFQVKTTLFTAGLGHCQVKAVCGVVGGHYRRQDAILVDSVDVDFENLTTWSGLSGVVQKLNTDDHSMDIHVRARDKVLLADQYGIRVSIEHFVHTSHPVGGLAIRERCVLQLEADTARPFSSYEKIVQSFQSFLSLAVGEPSYPTKIVAKFRESTSQKENQPVSHGREIEIIRSSSRSGSAKEVLFVEMPFTLVDMLNSKVDAFAQFLKVEDQLNPAFELFFPTYFFDLPPPQELLNMAHAIEALHRATIGGQYESDQEYSRGLKQRLLSAIPPELNEDYRTSLKRRLDFLNQFSLKRRLKDLLRSHAELVAQYIGDRD